MLNNEMMFEFDCKGFLVLRSLIEPALISELREASEPYRKPHYTQAARVLEKHHAFYKCIFHPAIEAISAQFFGAESTICNSVLVINPARIGGTEGMKLPAWHYDAKHGSYSYYETAWPCPLFQLRFFVAISDTCGPDSGGLALYPGSHRTKLKYPGAGEGAAKDSPVEKPVLPGTEVPEFKAGDCMIMHQAVWHTALKNTSERDRINFQVITTPNWIRSKEYEMVSDEFYARMEPKHQARLAYKWQ